MDSAQLADVAGRIPEASVLVWGDLMLDAYLVGSVRRISPEAPVPVIEVTETYDRLAHEFTPERCLGLDALLVTDPSLGVSRLRWLSTGPVEASAQAVKAEVEKLGFLLGMGAARLDMSVLPAEWRPPRRPRC